MPTPLASALHAWHKHNSSKALRPTPTPPHGHALLTALAQLVELQTALLRVALQNHLPSSLPPCGSHRQLGVGEWL